MRADPNPNPNPRARRRSQRGASRCSPSSTTARASTARAQSAARSAACSPASRRSATRAIGRARTAASRARRAAAGRTPSSSGDGPTSSARTERICGRRSSVCPWADPREASSRRSQPLHQRLLAIETSVVVLLLRPPREARDVDRRHGFGGRELPAYQSYLREVTPRIPRSRRTIPFCTACVQSPRVQACSVQPAGEYSGDSTRGDTAKGRTQGWSLD